MKKILILLALMINSCVEPSSGNDVTGVPNESQACEPSAYQQILCIAGVSDKASNTYNEEADTSASAPREVSAGEGISEAGAEIITEAGIEVSVEAGIAAGEIAAGESVAGEIEAGEPAGEEAGGQAVENEAECCSETDECNWANDGFCDCNGLFEWDFDDCAE